MSEIRPTVLVLGSPVLAGQLSSSKRLEGVDVTAAPELEDAMRELKSRTVDALVVHSPGLKDSDLAALERIHPDGRAFLVVDHRATGENGARPRRVRRPDVEDALVDALRARREAPKAVTAPEGGYAAGMAKLRQKFKDALPERLGLIAEGLDAVEKDASDDNLANAMSAAHKLAGAAGMFEMGEVAVAAVAIEKTIAKTRATGVDLETARAELEVLKAAVAKVLDG